MFAHVPLIHGPDGAKLSKRHGALGVEAYRAMGYLPAGLRNYLARLGWSHGDDEIFSTEQMIEWFDIDDINKAPGRLDFAKLADVNGHYIRQASDDGAAARASGSSCPRPRAAPQLAARIEAVGWDKLAAALPSLKERAKTLKELVDGAGYLLAAGRSRWTTRPPSCSMPRPARTLARLLPQLEARRGLAGRRRWRPRCATSPKQSGLKLGKVAQPLRAALTGTAVSPPVFDVMAVLGRDEALARIRDQAR